MNAYDQKRQEQREESTTKILDAAVGLFGEKGYANTTIKEIADEAGVSLALVFKYYGSKEKLLSAAYRYATTAAYPPPEGEPSLRRRTEALISQSIQTMKSKPETFRFFMTMLYTSDLPASYHAARREFFCHAPIYPSMREWQEQRKLPDGDLFDYFVTFMRTVYSSLEFYGKMSHLQGNERINAGVLLSYIVKAINEDMNTQDETAQSTAESAD